MQHQLKIQGTVSIVIELIVKFLSLIEEKAGTDYNRQDKCRLFINAIDIPLVQGPLPLKDDDERLTDTLSKNLWSGNFNKITNGIIGLMRAGYVSETTLKTTAETLKKIFLMPM